MIPMYEQHESNALSKSNVTGNNSTSNSVHEINYVYNFVFCYRQKIQTCSGHENHFQL